MQQIVAAQQQQPQGQVSQTTPTNPNNMDWNASSAMYRVYYKILLLLKKIFFFKYCPLINVFVIWCKYFNFFYCGVIRILGVYFCLLTHFCLCIC